MMGGYSKVGAQHILGACRWSTWCCSTFGATTVRILSLIFGALVGYLRVCHLSLAASQFVQLILPFALQF
jgi:hypothetical protein